MDLRQIITEAINATVLRTYATRLSNTIGAFRTNNIQLAGAVYNFVNNFNEYCNNIISAINDNRIDPPNQNQQQQRTGWFSNNSANMRHYMPNTNIYNNLKRLRLTPGNLLDGVGQAAYDSYWKTKEYIGLGKEPEVRGAVRQTAPDRSLYLRNLIAQKNGYLREYSRVQRSVTVQVGNIISSAFSILNAIESELNNG